MPSEYETLVAALKLTDIPFSEYGWKTRPEGTYGVVSLDMESDDFSGDGEKLDRSFEASVDVFFPQIRERREIRQTVEEILSEICGNAWNMNNYVYENTTGLFHIEWVCTLGDNAEE